MKKFITQITIFFSILILAYLAVHFTLPEVEKDKNDYMAAIIDKHQRAQGIKTPKLIFAGGSNLAFGIDSKKIADELAIPVVNLGLHAGLGLAFIIKELEAVAVDGDIVILSIEYFLSKTGDYELKTHTQQLFPIAATYYSKSIIDEITINIANTKKRLKSINQPKLAINPIYSRAAFNEFGDAVSHFDQPSPAKLKDNTELHYRYWEGIQLLNNFQAYAKSKQIKVYFTFPNYSKTTYEANKIAIKKLQQDILSNLLIVVLGTAEDFVIDDSLCFDTVYHLTKKGRDLRTKTLIELIKKLKITK